jgi:hypothetical protein
VPFCNPFEENKIQNDTSRRTGQFLKLLEVHLLVMLCPSTLPRAQLYLARQTLEKSKN